jgi:hypothetical protein
MMRAMMPGRVQETIEEATLEVRVRVVEQSRDPGVDVVEDDELVAGADHEHREGPDCDGQEDVDGVEVRRSQHLEPIQAVMNRMYPPQEMDFVRPAVVPVLEEVDDQGCQQQLEEDVGLVRPDVEDGDEVVVLGGLGEQADQQEHLKPVQGRRQQEVDDVGPGRLADVSPGPGEGDPELQAQDDEDHRDVEAVGYVLDGVGALHAPPEHQQRADQDAAVGVAPYERFEVLAPRRAAELADHEGPSAGSDRLQGSQIQGSKRMAQDDAKRNEAPQASGGRARPQDPGQESRPNLHRPDRLEGVCPTWRLDIGQMDTIAPAPLACTNRC